MTLKNLKGKALPGLVLSASVAMLSMAASPAFAHDASPEAQGQAGLPQASFNAQVFETVAQDTVTIVLAAQTSEANQEAAQHKLTETLESAMKQAKAQSQVEVRSGNFRVWPHTDKQGKITSWKGTAELVLESTDFSAASKLSSQLSDRMPIAGMRFSVSKALRAKHEQALLKEAARAFQDRAQAVADSLGFKAYGIKNVDVGGSGYMPQPMPRMSVASAAFSEKSTAEVPVEPGTETITLSMQGTVYLLGK
ncbi:SIMPL domain-containing protein [Pusillimonas sp. CC-YST705]|uniref:SIMPL domain-containing protein n=1 Tax=Mesopusillimonas faecipullorum TaxID=2755040 RepID=A0ABS8CBH0_9BURK|nr:SIMPL domain-containing protein [Mesopusillimonas faecipullorum]MCB5363386.1 SIMPL domain-containing protein [Mesopusillimonas faecipullorum]